MEKWSLIGLIFLKEDSVNMVWFEIVKLNGYQFDFVISLFKLLVSQHQYFWKAMNALVWRLYWSCIKPTRLVDFSVFLSRWANYSCLIDSFDLFKLQLTKQNINRRSENSCPMWNSTHANSLSSLSNWQSVLLVFPLSSRIFQTAN